MQGECSAYACTTCCKLQPDGTMALVDADDLLLGATTLLVPVREDGNVDAMFVCSVPISECVLLAKFAL